MFPGLAGSCFPQAAAQGGGASGFPRCSLVPGVQGWLGPSVSARVCAPEGWKQPRQSTPRRRRRGSGPAGEKAWAGCFSGAFLRAGLRRRLAWVQAHLTRPPPLLQSVSAGQTAPPPRFPLGVPPRCGRPSSSPRPGRPFVTPVPGLHVAQRSVVNPDIPEAFPSIAPGAATHGITNGPRRIPFSLPCSTLFSLVVQSVPWGGRSGVRLSL